MHNTDVYFKFYVSTRFTERYYDAFIDLFKIIYLLKFYTHSIDVMLLTLSSNQDRTMSLNINKKEKPLMFSLCSNHCHFFSELEQLILVDYAIYFR